jgi:tetratricopeptide (TPR) repeat protein
LKLPVYILSALLLVPALVSTSCKSKKELSSSGDPKTAKGLTADQETHFAFDFLEGCKERMRGNVENAESHFKECLKIDPSSPAAKYELGNIYRFAAQYDLALKYAKDCAAADPRNQWYQLLYIECLHSKRLYLQAADVYGRLVKIYPEKPEFYEGMAAEYMYAGSYDKSYKVYDELEKKFGPSETFTLNKIKLLKQTKKTTEAEEEFKKLIKLNPAEPRYYTYLAEFYQDTQQNEKALETYREVLKIDPNNPMVHLAMAEYYKSINDKENFFKEMKTAFENPDLDTDTKYKILTSYYDLSAKNDEFRTQAYELAAIMIRVHPKSGEAYGIYAEFLFRDKKTKEARDEFVMAVKYDKTHFDPWNKLMFSDAELQDYASLETHSAEAIELFPNQATPYYFNGLANIQLKNYDKAVESLRDGIEFVYSNNQLLIDFYSNLGLAYNYQKDYDKSDKAFDDALKVDPDEKNVLNNYAYFLSLRKKNLEKAEKYSRRSNELSPNNPVYMDTYGWILYQQGKYAQAEEWLASAAKIAGKRSAISEHYGDVLYQLEKKEEALIYWKQAKENGSGSEFLDKKISDKKLYE